MNTTAQSSRSSGVNVTTTVAPAATPPSRKHTVCECSDSRYADPVGYGDPAGYVDPVGYADPVGYVDAVDEHVCGRGHPVGDGAAGQVDPPRAAR